MVKPPCLNFRVITANLSGVGIFMARTYKNVSVFSRPASSGLVIPWTDRGIRVKGRRLMKVTW